MAGCALLANTASRVSPNAVPYSPFGLDGILLCEAMNTSTETSPSRPPRRDRKRPLKVVVSDDERAEIEARAQATGLSVSAYLRNLGLGYAPASTVDQQAIVALARVNADQGRLGG
ncbi:plasmid mobilization protein, partial [Xanthomonas phaseoli]